MKFQITLIENDWNPYTHFLYDTAKFFCYSIESLGHDCCIVRNKFDPGRVNIVVAGHHLRNPLEVKDLRRSGVPYVVLQTEIVKGGVLNNVPESKGFFEHVYLPLLQGARAVWENTRVNLPELQKHGIQAKVFLGGYHPALEEVVHKRCKDIDFLFFGSLTPHRRGLLKALADRGYQVTAEFDASAIYRNDLIGRAKVNLSMRQWPEMSHFPWGRITYLLNNRSLVVGENCLDQEWLEHCFPHADTEKWVDLCIEMLERPDREEVTWEYCERFKALPMTEQVEPLLEGLGTIQPKAIEKARIVWSAALLEAGSEADEARNLVIGLDYLDVPVKADPVKLTGQAAELSAGDGGALERMAQRPVEPNFIHVQHVEPRFYQVTPGAGANIGRAHCGTDRIPADWVAKCNALDEVWVPSDFSLDAFAFAGVDRSRLRKFPPSIDLWQFGDDVKPVKMTDKRGFVFLSVLDWRPQSGWDVLLRAAVEEFKANEDVGLVLKFMLPQEVTAQRVAEEIRDFLKGTLKLSGPIPKLDIHLDPVCPGLYRAVDAFVLPCRAEGLGRHCMEAMASGLPVIATGWGGQTEFMNSENAYLIQYSLTDVPESVVDQSPHLEGSRWAEPSVEHLRFLMRQVLENRAEAKQKGQKAREHIAMNYSREQIARQVKERLEAIFENVKARVGQ